jgi:protease IV
MNQFLKQTFASTLGSLAGLILFCVLGTSGLVFLLIAASLGDRGPQVKDKSILVYDLSTRINDTQPPPTFTQALSSEETPRMTLREVVESIEKAAKDRRIVGIFLDGRKVGEGNGYASLKEVRGALEKFRESGKKIIAYDVDANEQEYYLSSAADTLILNPMGTMEINGLSSQQLFFSEAFKKYGIGVQVVRVGNYKSAVEPFTRQNLSPENREQIEALLTDVWRDFLATVSQSRKIFRDELQKIADNQGVLSPEKSRTAGLVDRVAYFDNVVADLRKLTGEKERDTKDEEEPFRQVDMATYADVRVKEYQPKTSKNKVTVLYAEGEIVNGDGNVQEIGGDRFAKDLRKLREDEDIKAVVLRINSPGGSATASDVILREVQLLREKKPVIISMGDVAASGGYWIATGGNRIFAQENTVTGSIGVFGLLLNLQQIAKNNGINSEAVKTANLADIDSSIRPKSAKELGVYQEFVNQIYEMFLDKVAKSRNLPREKVAQIAQGRVWSGEDAKNLGLVDRLGGLESAIQDAAQEAKLGNDWEVEEYSSQDTFESEILKKLFAAQSSKVAQPVDPLTVEFLKLKRELAKLQALDDPKGVYARLSFNWSIR